MINRTSSWLNPPVPFGSSTKGRVEIPHRGANGWLRRMVGWTANRLLLVVSRRMVDLLLLQTNCCCWWPTADNYRRFVLTVGPSVGCRQYVRVTGSLIGHGMRSAPLVRHEMDSPHHMCIGVSKRQHPATSHNNCSRCRWYHTVGLCAISSSLTLEPSPSPSTWSGSPSSSSSSSSNTLESVGELCSDDDEDSVG